MHSVITNPSPFESRTLHNRVRDFFYAEETPFGLALVRILICFACLLVTVPRWIHSRELFSSDGAPAPLAVNYGIPDLLPIPPGGPAVAMMTVLTFCCATALIGWWTRTSLAIATVLYTYLNLLDSLSTMTKYSVITSHLLLLLSCSQCGAVWSVDAWLRRRRLGLPSPQTLADYPRFAAWPRRLIQLLIGIVYFGASITKMHTPAYFSGDQLWHWMMTNVNNANPVGEWLTLFPALLVVFAYACVVWEVLFVFLSWHGWGRICMIGIGAVFHVMTALSLGLYLFPLTCLSTYCAFVESADVDSIAQRWRRWRRGHREFCAKQLLRLTRLRQSVFGQAIARIGAFGARLNPRASFGAFVLLLLGVTVSGVEAEFRLDPFGDRRAGGPFELVEIDPEMKQRMMTGDMKVREYDKFLALDIGTELFGGMVLGQKDTFRHGENILVQCTLSPPHEDMWVECNLHDASNVMLDRVGQVVVRSQLRGNFLYRACQALEPGSYFIVLKTGGREITRRRIQIQEGACRPLAN